MTDTATTAAHLRYPADTLPRQVQEHLLGPGCPFEMGIEEVLGVSMTVFTHRARTLRQLFDASAVDRMNRPFLVTPDSSWTNREALADIDAIAACMSATYGIGKGDRVAVVAANSAEYALTVWATISLGAVVTSLNGWWTTPELEYGIALTAPGLVVGDSRRLERLTEHSVPDGVPVVDLVHLLRDARDRDGDPAPTPHVDEDDPAVILFTSGTTGRPKGATLSHRNIINFVQANALGGAVGAMTAPPAATPPPPPATILTSPMFHISGLVATLGTGPVFGSTLVFARPGAWDPGEYLELTEKYQVSSWSGVPTNYWRLLKHPDLATRDLSSVTVAGSGGAVFPPELVRALHEALPGARLGNGFGMSETVGLGTITGGDLFLRVPDSVGPASPTVEVQIRGDDGAVLAEGEVGEIHLRTPSVFLGYWNNGDATAAVLDGERWYRTGDFGRVSGGLLYLASRRRDLILRGGENVYPIEIENRLVEHPLISDAAIIGVPHHELGQDVKAFVVCEGEPLTAEKVQEWCAAGLARYKVPSEVEFRDALPYSLTGKLLKKELEEQERASREAMS